MKQFKKKALRKCIKSIQRRFHAQLSPMEHLQLEKILKKLKSSKHSEKKKSRPRFDFKRWLNLIPTIIEKCF